MNSGALFDISLDEKTRNTRNIKCPKAKINTRTNKIKNEESCIHCTIGLLFNELSHLPFNKRVASSKDVAALKHLYYK